MDDQIWTQVAHEAINYLAPYGPVIMMGLETASRLSGKRIERKAFVNAKSVYAVLKTSFERDQQDTGRTLLENFVKEPDAYKEQIIALVAQRSASAPQDLGRKMIAITNRWRKDKRPLPTAKG